MPKRAAYGSYIFKPDDSPYWWFRYQYPREVRHVHGRQEKFALLDHRGNRVTDERLAHTLKLPHIETCRRRVWAVRNEQGHSFDGVFARRMKVTSFGWRYALGETIHEDGSRTLATETKAITFKDGVLIAEAANERLIATVTHDFIRSPTGRLLRNRSAA